MTIHQEKKIQNFLVFLSLFSSFSFHFVNRCDISFSALFSGYQQIAIPPPPPPAHHSRHAAAVLAPPAAHPLPAHMQPTAAAAAAAAAAMFTSPAAVAATPYGYAPLSPGKTRYLY